jgi:excisionase family DNA binding protein
MPDPYTNSLVRCEGELHQMRSRGITIQEAAAYLSTTVPAIRRLISTRELPFTKLGKRFILDRQDLDKWLEKKKHLA